MTTKRVKDLLTVITILGSILAKTDKGNKGKVGELLNPSLEKISLFDMKKLVADPAQYEDSHCLFEDKPTANFNHGAAGEEKKPNKDKYSFPDQAKIKKLKSKTKNVNFSTEAWEKNTTECMNVTYHTTGKAVCFWFIESACLDRRTAVYREIPDPTK